MDFILVSAKHKEKIEPYLDLLKDFKIKIRESEVIGIGEEYLLKEYIITLDIEDLIKLRKKLNKRIIIDDCYYDSETEIHDNVNVLKIYDDYIE
ncbi:hypothetical protein [Clostridium perfringens]|uniref:hypothetical protein n=1 Tax=Clostridium perfringens TaxID=1502 RepID=UPI00096A8613|nr:hypothetical protein [Clostridium perfringens]